MTARQKQYWFAVGGVLLAIATVSASIYHPGELVEFSDTIYPVRPDLTMEHWLSWWWTGNLGTLWTNTCWLPHLVIPWFFWRLGIAPGIGQAFQYFVWLAVPTTALAFCIAGLAEKRSSALAAAPLLIVPFNLYVVLSWPSSVADYAFGAEALFAWALVEGIELGRWRRGLLVAACAAIWSSPDAGNPPYLLIVALSTVAFALWLILRRREALARSLVFCAGVAAVVVLVSVRWIVPVAITYTHYPLAKLAIGGDNAFSFVTARANLLNALRFTPMWYWGNASYTSYAWLYQDWPLLVVGSFAPFFVVLLGIARAVRKRAVWALGLFAIALLWMFMVKGINAPFVRLSFSIEHLPLMGLLRDREKFIGPFLVDTTIALGMVFAAERVRLVAAAYVAVVAFAAIAGGWLLFTGEAFNAPRGTPPLYVKIPPVYARLADAAKGAGTTRLAITPNDSRYEIGTTWGFFGADTEFFDDVPDAPLLHAPYAGYVRYAGYDELWHVYSDLSNDAIARRTLDSALSVSGTIARNDIMPYVGTDRFALRRADLRKRYSTVDDGALTLYEGSRVPFAREYVTLLSQHPDEYDRTMTTLARLGIGVPLVDAAGAAPPQVREVEAAGNGSHAAAFVLLPDVEHDGTVDTLAGDYDVIVRAASTPAVRREIDESRGPAPRPPAEPILGESAGIFALRSSAEPAGGVYHYKTEGAYPAQAVLKLPLLGPSHAQCADVYVGGDRVARRSVRYGKQWLLVPARVPPGEFKVTVRFDDSGNCAGAPDSGAAPLWTTGNAPPAVIGITRPRGRGGLTFARAYDVDMPLSSNPQLLFWYSGDSPKKQDVFVVAHVGGDGCRTQVAVRYGENVLDRFTDIGRRPILPPACTAAGLNRLRITGADVVVSASRYAVAQPPTHFALIPSAKAQDWQLSSVPVPSIERQGVRTWHLTVGPIPVGEVPVASLTIPKNCVDWYDVKYAFSGGTSQSVDVEHLSLFQSDVSDQIVVPIGELARQQGAAASAAIESIDLASVAPAPMKTTCEPRGANVASDAPASVPASIRIDGRTLAVPRDDAPHRYRMRLSAGRHSVGFAGPVSAIAMFHDGILAAGHGVPATPAGLVYGDAPPGWIVYAQAADSLWHATVGNAGLPQYRADADLQAYYVPRAGTVRISLGVIALQPVAELVTWVTLAALLLLAGYRWRKE